MSQSVPQQRKALESAPATGRNTQLRAHANSWEQAIRQLRARFRWGWRTATRRSPASRSLPGADGQPRPPQRSGRASKPAALRPQLRPTAAEGHRCAGGGCCCAVGADPFPSWGRAAAAGWCARRAARAKPARGSLPRGMCSATRRREQSGSRRCTSSAVVARSPHRLSLA